MMPRAKTGKANMSMRNENTYQHVLRTTPVRYHLLLESKWPLRLRLVFFYSSWTEIYYFRSWGHFPSTLNYDNLQQGLVTGQ